MGRGHRRGNGRVITPVDSRHSNRRAFRDSTGNKLTVPLRDLLGISISVGTVHQVLQLVTQKAGVLNRDQDLSGIRVGLHNEIFHDGKPVPAGVEAASTYCYYS